MKTVKPLEARTSDGALATVTGRAALDALMTEARIEKIDAVFGSTGRRAKDPDAARRYGLDRIYRFHVPPGTDVEALSVMLSALPVVEYAEPDPIVHARGLAPNDPLYLQQWGLAAMGAEDAWSISVGEDVVIAVLDSGIDSDHPDLAGKTIPGYDFVNDDTDPEDDSVTSHGTQVASVLSAATNNAEGIAGVCWNCRLLPVKVLDSEGSGTASEFAEGLVWAVDQGARIVNFSSGGASPNATRLVAINYAYDSGVILVGGVGNGDELGVVYPKARKEFIAVGGTNQLDERASPYSCAPGGSNFGPEIDVVAPADLLDVAMIGGGYGVACGNSLSGPEIAGVLGIVETLNASIGREEARHLLRSGAVDQVGAPSEDTPGFDIYHGWGRVDMPSTIAAAASSVSLRVEGKTSTRVYLETANPIADSYDFVRGDLTALSEGPGGVDLGSTVCIEDDSADADTAGGNEDTDVPAPGEGFFYLSRFSAAPGHGSYGGSSTNRDRAVFPSAIASWSAESDQGSARLGAAVRTAGDVNDDGFADIIVGASLYDLDLADEGAAFVFHGSASGLPANPSWTEP
ncbi:MAG: S8 family serine peptidase, partial [Acidobacteriota bacterium]|nr:S8 family serine peptidase [Acidobacteriota bacterium]